METLFIGRNLIFLPEINSTNSYATDLLKNVNLPEGTVVHAAHQTHGKGQRGSTWIADAASNLTASVILKPSFLDLQKQFFLYQIIALATYDTLAEILDSSQFDIKIKWPNDILVNQKKTAGILIENNIQNNRFNWCVAGIGINVNQEGFDAQLKAGSLRSFTGVSHAVADVLALLCKHIEKYYLALKNGRLAFIRERYLGHFFGLGTWMDFEIGNAIEQRMVCGISEKGLLLMRDRGGKETESDVKEIRWIY